MKRLLDGMEMDLKGREVEVELGMEILERSKKGGGKKTLKRKRSSESRNYLDEG